MEPANEINTNSEQNIDYNLYKDNPDKLFLLANEFFNKNEFEKGLEVLEKSLNLAIEKYGSETKIEMAKYYNEYGGGLVRKLMENDEILNLPNEGLENQETKNNENNNLSKEKNEDDDKEFEQDDSDENIALENLSVANKLYTDYLKEYDNKNVSELSEEIIDYYLQLADNYYNIGSFQRVKSDYQSATNLFEKAISIRKKYDSKCSRKLASLYFEEAQVLDFDPHKCLLVLFKAKLIMEHYLKLSLEKVNSKLKIEINDNDLELTEIKTDDKKIYLNRNIIESEEMNNEAKKYSEVDEFQGIIKDIYPKIEDVILEINEFAQYKKEKEKMKLLNHEENKFNTNYDSSKVIDISKTSLIKKKRPREKDPDELDIESDKEKINENQNNP